MKRPPFKIVSAERAEQATFVVCMRVGTGDMFRFDDNQYGKCADCGHAIYFRPYNPTTPPKICAHCALDRAGIPEADKQRLKDQI